MQITHYQEFELQIGQVPANDGGAGAIEVTVLKSPAGDGGPFRQEIPANLDQTVRGLDAYALSIDEITTFGMALADLLLPADARALFTASLARLGQTEGLRLRLRLAPGLANLPWEYLYIKRDREGEADRTGFLALDPRLSIVRHQQVAAPALIDMTPRERRMLIALAGPDDAGLATLDLEQDLANIREALQNIPGIIRDELKQATIEMLPGKVRGTQMFHFAGHGEFKRTGLGAAPKSFVGHGEIVLVDQSNKPVHIPADQFAINLRGVELAVLSACKTGRRDKQNLWSSTAAALMEVGVPVVVAMQYSIWDDSAIAFSREFYQSLAAGLTLDQAVSAGRLAVFNKVNLLQQDPERKKFWQDWGAAVLYDRTRQDVVLPTITDPGKRQAAASGPRAVVNEHFQRIERGGSYVAFSSGVIKGGTIEIRTKVDVVEEDAEVTSLKGKAMTAGNATVEGEYGTVKGKVTGIELDSFGDYDEGRP